MERLRAQAAEAKAASERGRAESDRNRGAKAGDGGRGSNGKDAARGTNGNGAARRGRDEDRLHEVDEPVPVDDAVDELVFEDDVHPAEGGVEDDGGSEDAGVADVVEAEDAVPDAQERDGSGRPESSRDVSPGAGPRPSPLNIRPSGRRPKRGR
jgi:hypothetical protein